MRRYVVPVLVALLVGAALLFFGLPLIASIVVFLVVAAVLIALRVIFPQAGSFDWPSAPPPKTEGARHEASDLTWSMRTRSGALDDRVVERVRRIATTLLYHRHLDIGNPRHRARIERLVGADVYAVLIAPDPPRMTLSTLLGMLDRIESLEANDPASRITDRTTAQ